MAIASLINIPGTAEEFSQWTFAHFAHHLDIVNTIYNTLSIALPIYMLDPFDPTNANSAEAWAYLHQSMHQNQNQVLGIEGFDLTDIDWQDQNQVAAWIQLNATEHLQAGNILGIG